MMTSSRTVMASSLADRTEDRRNSKTAENQNEQKCLLAFHKKKKILCLLWGRNDFHEGWTEFCHVPLQSSSSSSSSWESPCSRRGTSCWMKCTSWTELAIHRTSGSRPWISLSGLGFKSSGSDSLLSQEQGKSGFNMSFVRDMEKFY